MSNQANTLEEFDDIEVELDDFKFDVIKERQEEFVDVRDFVEKCFNDFSQTHGMSRRPIRKIICVGNEEPVISKDGEIAILVKYKNAQGRGRRSVLAGETVLHISMPNGDFRIPLDQAEKYGKYLIGIARSAQKTTVGLPQANDEE